MGFFDGIKEGIQNHFDRKQKDKEMLENLRKEAAMQEQVAFEKAFREDARKVAVARAKKDAARLSGLQKMQAQNRLRNLNKMDRKPDSIMTKFAAYTQQNMAKREENLKANKERQEDARKVREERLDKMRTTKPFR